MNSNPRFELKTTSRFNQDLRKLLRTAQPPPAYPLHAQDYRSGCRGSARQRLFEVGGGETVREKLLETTELHTILRLPTGISYTNGVKAIVRFLDNREASKEVATKEVWYYDYRTNIHHTLKRKPLRLEDLRDFIDCYNPSNHQKRKETWHPEKSPEGRWRKYSYKDLIARDKTSLDLFWLKDESLADLDNLPEPEILAEEIIENIEAGLASFRAVAATLSRK